IKGLIDLFNGKWETKESFLVRTDDGSEVRMSPDDLLERQKQYLGPFQEWVGTLVGEMSFRTAATVGGGAHHVRFQAPVFLANLGRVGLLKPPTYTYNTMFDIDQVGYERRIQISHEIKPGETDRFTVKVAIV